MSQITSRVVFVFLVAATLFVWNSYRPSDAQDEGGTKVDELAPTETRLAPPRKTITTARQGFSKQSSKEAIEQEFFPAMSESESRIEAALLEKTTMEFIDTPMTDAIAFLADQHKISIIVDQTALDDGGVATDTPLTCKIGEVSLNSGLEVALSPLDLTFETRNEVLYITTVTASFEHTTNRVYPVADLVTADENSYEELVEAIEKTTETQWLESSGEGGTISVIRANGSVSILQTYRGHRAVVKFLRSMRQARTAQGPLPAPRHDHGDHNHHHGAKETPAKNVE
jgi:hypothetical protein